MECSPHERACALPGRRTSFANTTVPATSNRSALTLAGAHPAAGRLAHVLTEDYHPQVAAILFRARATALGMPVAEVVTEVGSGLNGRRRKLHRISSDPNTAVIVVEHRDRVARFGVEHVEAVLAASGRRLVVLDPAETADDLVRDVTEVLTSLCARLCGRRAARNRAARAVAAAVGGDAE